MNDIPDNREVLFVLFCLKTCKTAKTAEFRRFTDVSLVVAGPETVSVRTPTARGSI